MGQKVNPHGARVGVIKGWDTRWYADKKHFADFLIEDHKIRTHLKEKLADASVSKIEIERAAGKITVNIFTARPGIVIGRGGAGVEAIRKDLAAMTGKTIALNVVEIRNADLDAQLVAENIASQLERRISFRRALKQAPRASRRRSAVAWAAPKSPAARATTKVPSRCRPCAPISTTALPRRTRPTDASASRSGSTKGRSFLRRRALPPRKREAAKNVDAEKSKAPQGFPRPHEGCRPSRQLPCLR